MIRKWISGVIALVWLSMTVFSMDDSIKAQRQIRFADHLFDQGRFADARLEYRRYLCLGGADRCLGFLMVARSYQVQGRFQEAAEAFEEVLDKCDEGRGLRFEAHRDLVRNCIFRKEYALAGYELSQLQGYPQDSARAAQNALFAILLDMHQYRMDSARVKIDRITASSPLRAEVKELTGLVAEYRAQDFKRPSTALIYSAILPGLGQWYAGEKIQGVRMFLLVSSLTAVFGYGAYTAVTTDDRRVRMVAAMDCTVWGVAVWRRYYLSARNKAYLAAAHHNRSIQQRFQKRLAGFEARLVGMQPVDRDN